MPQIGTLFLVAIVGLTSAHSRDNLPVFEYEYYVKYDLASQTSALRCDDCEDIPNNDDDLKYSEALCVGGIQRSLLGPEFDGSCESDDDVVDEPIARALSLTLENHVDLICRVRKDNEVSRISVPVSSAAHLGKNEIYFDFRRSLRPVNPNEVTTQNPNNDDTTTEQKLDDNSTTEDDYDDDDDTTTTTQNPDDEDVTNVPLGNFLDDIENVADTVANVAEGAVIDGVKFAGEAVNEAVNVAGQAANLAGQTVQLAEKVAPYVEGVAKVVVPVVETVVESL